MGSVGDESHDAIAKEVTEECQNLKTEVPDAEGLATQNPQQVNEAEAEVVQETEGLATQIPPQAHKAEVEEVAVEEAEVQVEEAAVEVAEVQVEEAEVQVKETAVEETELQVEEAAVEEAEVQVEEAAVEEAEVQKSVVHEGEGLATRKLQEALEAEDLKAEVDAVDQKLSAVMGAGTDDRDNVEPEFDAAVQPTVRRKLPEVRRFSARRSVGAEDPKTNNRNDESKSPSTIRKQRGAHRLSARMNTGIDDRDTVDYTREDPKPPVVKDDTVDYTREDPKPPVVKDDTVVVKEVSPKQQQLSVAERERLRLLGIKRNKNIVCLERIRGKLVNITEGLELHTGVFSRVEQTRLIDLVRELQAKGRRQELKDRTYSEPRKWMRGKGRVTLQFGCCYNYAIDKQGNPPGILREDVVDPIPPLLRTTIKRLVRWHVLPPSCVPDSCIINMYEEGDCIPPHIDHHDFLRPFCTLSLLSECNIVFGANLEILGPGDFGGNLSLPLPVGSVLVLNGNGADVAKHAVPAVPTERISITFRKMDPSKVPAGFTLDKELQNLKPVSLPS